MKLNRDLLLMISENFQNDRISLYSCLLVNRSWCEAIVPLLWKIPGQAILTKKAENIIFNVILSHFSEESRDNLIKQGIDLFTEIYQTPSFNYIYFWRHLDLQLLDRMISRNFDKSDISMMRNELFKLFVNNNTNFISLIFPYDYKCQVNWNKQCFLNLKFFYFCNDIDQSILKELATISKSIKIFNCDVIGCNISGTIRLIEVQKNLDSVRISGCRIYETWQSIEEVLIKKAITIQNLYLCYDWNFDVDLKFLSHFVNLKSLEIIESFGPPNPNNTILNLNQSEKMSLPALKILKTNQVSFMMLTRLIESANVQLTVIDIHFNDIYCEFEDVRRFFQAMCQNCPNIKYLSFPIKDYVLIEFESLLINCQHLIKLVIRSEGGLQYKNLFKILNKSSPSSLIKFGFTLNRKFGAKYKLLRSFLANWKGRHTMLLQIWPVNYCLEDEQEVKRLYELIEYYEARGIVKKIDWEIDWCSNDSEESIWIKKRCFH
ncbi:hypothetical protein RhiirC2_792184 [Rhizophagus irregularis]|uniref:F-box domain-containing protein n=1 Tax=Rhizophagus irregularis TaxID=588596 RepID=A0A2N1MHR2_9GLOM|nr:hypothetical protein RhiirC2_792184 [Rhizophagus irregularis]